MKNIIKKITAFLCAFSMLLSIMIVAQASGVQLIVASETITQGDGTESVTIPLNISGNTGILGMTLQISYTEGLTLTNIKAGTALGSLTFTKPGNFNANPFNLVWDGLNDADITNGTVAILEFNVPKSVAKTYSVNASLDSAFDDNLKNMSITVSNGSITVKSGYEPISPLATINSFKVTNYGANSLVDITAENAPDEVKLCIASFDSEGKLLEIQLPTLISGESSAIFATNGVKQYKVYIWDDDLNPLSLNKEYMAN